MYVVVFVFDELMLCVAFDELMLCAVSMNCCCMFIRKTDVCCCICFHGPLLCLSMHHSKLASENTPHIHCLCHIQMVTPEPAEYALRQLLARFSLNHKAHFHDEVAGGEEILAQIARHRASLHVEVALEVGHRRRSLRMTVPRHAHRIVRALPLVADETGRHTDRLLHQIPSLHDVRKDLEPTVPPGVLLGYETLQKRRYG